MSARRSAANAVSSARSSSFCTSRLPLFFLAGLAGSRPRNGVQSCLGDRFAALTTHPVGSLLDAAQRALYGLQDLGVGLFELELNVDFVVARGLICHVPL